MEAVLFLLKDMVRHRQCFSSETEGRVVDWKDSDSDVINTWWIEEKIPILVKTAQIGGK